MPGENDQIIAQLESHEDALYGVPQGYPVQVQLDELKSAIDNLPQRVEQEILGAPKRVDRNRAPASEFIQRGQPVGLSTSDQKAYVWNATNPIFEYIGIAEESTDKGDIVTCVIEGRFDFKDSSIVEDKNLFVTDKGAISQVATAEWVQIGIGIGNGAAILSRPSGFTSLKVKVLYLADTDVSNFLGVSWGEDDDTDRTLKWKVVEGDREVTVEANAIIAQDYSPDSTSVTFGALRLDQQNHTRALEIYGSGTTAVNEYFTAFIDGEGETYLNSSDPMHFKGIGHREFHFETDQTGSNLVAFFRSDPSYSVQIMGKDTGDNILGFLYFRGSSHADAYDSELLNGQDATASVKLRTWDGSDYQDRIDVSGGGPTTFKYNDGATMFDMQKVGTEPTLQALDMGAGSDGVFQLRSTVNKFHFIQATTTHQYVTIVNGTVTATTFTDGYTVIGTGAITGFNTIFDGAGLWTAATATLSGFASISVGALTATTFSVDHIKELTGAHGIVFDNDVGIGVTPSYKLDIDAGADVLFCQMLNAQAGFQAGGFGGDLYFQSTNATGDGVADLRFTSFGGAAIPALAFTATISNFTGKVGVGTAIPKGAAVKLHVANGTNADTNWYANAPLVVERTNHAYINIRTPNDKYGGIMFSDPDATYSGIVDYSHATDLMGFHTSATLKMTLSATGILSIDHIAELTAAHNIVIDDIVHMDVSAKIGDGTKHDGFVISDAFETQTATTTPTSLTKLTLLDENTYQVQAYISGVKYDGSERGGYIIAATAYRTGGGSAVIEGQTSLHEAESDPNWDATFIASGNDLIIRVTGTATTIEWGCTYSYMNMSN